MGNGGIMGKVNTVAIDGASGVYELNEVFLSKLEITWPGSPPPLDVDFLVIGGGGGAVGYGTGYNMTGGGGAGGYLNSYGSESSGANSTGLSALALAMGTNYTVTVGAGGSAGHNDGADSVLSGTDRNGVSFNHTAAGGGAGGGTTSSDALGNNGGCAGGGSHLVDVENSTGTAYNNGDGTANQGSNGGSAAGTITGPYNEYWCDLTGDVTHCLAIAQYGGGGGGGAGAAGSDGSTSGGGDGGDGLASSITGASVTRAGGGAGSGRVGSAGADKFITNGSAGSGQSNAGGGANAGASDTAGNAGTVILRYPDAYTISFNGNVLTGTTTTDGDYKVTEFTAGTGTVSFGA